eukprot:TRINITY_DN66123_c9_g1_i1.p1 TRINITY_DN66123_c9_g1~~TRINITY_DN66123_c9_g1_i1.p1  ORF type:complete len:401 (-),score=32.18 TRINITY_DN66123_c9_g1_i1:987-2189(-)
MSYLHLREDDSSTDDQGPPRAPAKEYCCGVFEMMYIKDLESINEALDDDDDDDDESWTFNVILGKTDLTQVEVGALQANPENCGATFQVASNFNCLEFVSPYDSATRGITGYIHDHTQGPAAAISAAPGTIQRNYFVKHTKICPDEDTEEDSELTIKDEADSPRANKTKSSSSSSTTTHTTSQRRTQTKQKPNKRRGSGGEMILEYRGQLEEQINLLDEYELIDIQNGYIQIFDQARARLRKEFDFEDHDMVKVGIQRNTQVTYGLKSGGIIEVNPHTGQRVHQVFTAAMANPRLSGTEAKLAKWVLLAAYEGTIRAAWRNSKLHPNYMGSRKVFLTLVGGGVFGNPKEWIMETLEELMPLMKRTKLEFNLVVFRASEIREIRDRLKRMVKEGSGEMRVV